MCRRLLITKCPVYANRMSISVHACVRTCSRLLSWKQSYKTLEWGAVKHDMLIYAQSAELSTRCYTMSLVPAKGMPECIIDLANYQETCVPSFPLFVNGEREKFSQRKYYFMRTIRVTIGNTELRTLQIFRVAERHYVGSVVSVKNIAVSRRIFHRGRCYMLRVRYVSTTNKARMEYASLFLLSFSRSFTLSFPAFNYHALTKGATMDHGGCRLLENVRRVEKISYTISRQGSSREVLRREKGGIASSCST